jgi:hypothetical protein
MSPAIAAAASAASDALAADNAVRDAQQRADASGARRRAVSFTHGGRVIVAPVVGVERLPNVGAAYVVELPGGGTAHVAVSMARPAGNVPAAPAFLPGDRVAATVPGEPAPFVGVVVAPSGAHVLSARGPFVSVRFDGYTGPVPFRTAQLVKVGRAFDADDVRGELRRAVHACADLQSLARSPHVTGSREHVRAAVAVHADTARDAVRQIARRIGVEY